MDVSPYESNQNSQSSTSAIITSNPAARVKKNLNNSVLDQKRPFLNKKLKSKFPELNAMNKAYISNMKINKNAFKLNKKSGKLKPNKFYKVPKQKKTTKRREYNLIDLTLNHEDDNSLGSYSDFNQTIDPPLPLLQKRTPNEGRFEEERPDRVSRSLERGKVKDPLNSGVKRHKNNSINLRENDSNNSIVISEQAVGFSKHLLDNSFITFWL